MNTPPLAAALAHLASVNGLTRRQLDDAIFQMRAAVWRERRQVVIDADLLAALEIGLAADAARIEHTEAQRLPPETLAFAPIPATAYRIPRVTCRFPPAFVRR